MKKITTYLAHTAAKPYHARVRIASTPTQETPMLDFIWMIVSGFIVGLIARALHPGQDNLGCLYTIALGIVGAMVAGFIGRTIGWYEYGEPVGFVMSILGAILLLVLLGRIGKKR